MNETNALPHASFFQSLDAELTKSTEQLPLELLHYTNASGLLGIVGQNELRATNALYLNDADEIKYGISVFKETIAKTKSEISVQSLRDTEFFEAAENWSEWLGATKYYVCCLSAASNQLSQWRAYRGSGTGYAIVFETSGLQTLSLDDSPLTLIRVNYDREQQLHLASTALRKFLVYFNGLTGWNGDDLLLFEPFFGWMGLLLIGMKRRAFAEEQEWRLVHRQFPFFTETLTSSFRTSASGLIVPYRTIKGTANFPLPISKVIVGPSIQPELAKESADELLHTSGFPFANAEFCNISLRDL